MVLYFIVLYCIVWYCIVMNKNNIILLKHRRKRRNLGDVGAGKLTVVDGEA